MSSNELNSSESEPESLLSDESPTDVGMQESSKKLSLNSDTVLTEKKKKAKAGVIYLSTIPPKMNVTRIREYFSQFGDINRSFLQPEEKPWKGKRKVKNQTFTEGWIEFKKRKHAKRVAEMLNNQPVGGKKSKAYHDHLWNIKYLQGFQWVHLNERLAYERISRQQKLRNEISAAKRESSFFAKNVDLSKKLKKKGLLNKTPKLGDNSNSPNSHGTKNKNSGIRIHNVGEIPTSFAEKQSAKRLSSESTDKKRKNNSGDQSNDRRTFLKSMFGK